MHAPSPKALSLAMSMIDTQRWSLAGRAVELVRAFTIDDPEAPKNSLVELSQDQVRGFFGGQSRYVWRVLRGLVDDQVLRCRLGGGSRPSAWGVSGDFGRWANVPWRRPLAEILTRIAFAVEPPPRREGTAGDATHTASGLAVAPRRIPRRWNSPATRHAARHNGALGDAASIAALAREDPDASPFLFGRSKDLPPVEDEDEDEAASRQAEKALRDAIAGATDGGSVFGAPGRRLVALAARANGNVGAMVRAVQRTRGVSAVGLVSMLEELERSGALSEPPPSPSRERPACVTCGSSGWVEVEDGAVAPCPGCRASVG